MTLKSQATSLNFDPSRSPLTPFQLSHGILYTPFAGGGELVRARKIWNFWICLQLPCQVHDSDCRVQRPSELVEELNCYCEL